MRRRAGLHDGERWSVVCRELPHAAQPRELLSLYQTQFRAAATDLKTALHTQIDRIYANGRPTEDQLKNLETLVIGAVDATAIGVSSQVGLLPAAGDTLVPRIQDALLSSNRSLSTQLNGIIGYGRFNQSASRLKTMLDRTIDQYANRATREFRNFLNTTPLYRLSVDNAGQQVPIQQYIAQQVVARSIIPTRPRPALPHGFQLGSLRQRGHEHHPELAAGLLEPADRPAGTGAA